MSDNLDLLRHVHRSDNLDLLRHVHRIDDQVQQTLVVERIGVRLPYAQRALNPLALAAAPANVGDFPQSRPVTLLAWYTSVYVATTNNGANYWTLKLIDGLGTVLSTVNTSAIAANTFTRLVAASATQPSSTNVALTVQATVGAGAPGAIYIVPEIIVA